MLSETQKQKLIKECVFSSARSSGPGGQNVNKVNTKIELRFNIEQCKTLNALQLERINQKLKNRINSDAEIVINSQSTRSQLKNKQLAVALFIKLIENALKQPKKRVPTKPSKAAKMKRLENKKLQSDKKNRRTKDWL